MLRMNWYVVHTLVRAQFISGWYSYHLLRGCSFLLIAFRSLSFICMLTDRLFHIGLDCCSSGPSFVGRWSRLSGFCYSEYEQEAPIFRWRWCECICCLWGSVLRYYNINIALATDTRHPVRWYWIIQGYLLAPFEIPRNHPDCDQYFELEETPYNDFPVVYFDHPDIYEAYRQEKPLPKGHPSVSGMVS